MIIVIVITKKNNIEEERYHLFVDVFERKQQLVISLLNRTTTATEAEDVARHL
jgi:hypothetical protein